MHQQIVSQLISEQAFAKATGMDRFPLPGLNKLLMALMKINRFNDDFQKVGHLKGMEFIDAVLDLLGIKVQMDEVMLRHIPKKGAFIVLANHPFGGIEGLILLKLIGSVRPDVRLMANFLLEQITALKAFIIPVNPFENVQHPSSISGVKKTVELLQSGTPVAIFPAGEVSAFQPSLQRVTDKKWHPVVGKLIAKAGVPVVPVYFHGNNSLLFNLVGLIHPTLRTARLPAELFNKSGYVVQVRMGGPVLSADLAFLRARTYALGTGIPPGHKRLSGISLFKIKAKPEPLVPEISVELLDNEIQGLGSYQVWRESGYEVYIAPASVIPFVIKEIGRLREKTFRAVGEGTNKPIDLDVFDIYYQHLFVWDSKARRLVGSYRIGRGDELFYGFGKKGFYLSELFKISRPFYPILRASLELGRSWISAPYQQKPLSLYLLWKGIAQYLLKNPQYRYLIGPASISNSFSRFSKSLMVAYIQKHHYDVLLAGMVKARKQFRPDLLKLDTLVLMNHQRSLQDLERLITENEGMKLRFPVLLRHYLAMNARIIAFNVDPKFSDSLDGFLVLDLKQLPEDMESKLFGSNGKQP